MPEWRKRAPRRSTSGSLTFVPRGLGTSVPAGWCRPPAQRGPARRGPRAARPAGSRRGWCACRWCAAASARHDVHRDDAGAWSIWRTVSAVSSAHTARCRPRCSHRLCRSRRTAGLPELGHVRISGDLCGPGWPGTAARGPGGAARSTPGSWFWGAPWSTVTRTCRTTPTAPSCPPGPLRPQHRRPPQGRGRSIQRPSARPLRRLRYQRTSVPDGKSSTQPTSS